MTIKTNWRNSERNRVTLPGDSDSTESVRGSAQWRIATEIPVPQPLWAAYASASLPGPAQGLLGSWDVSTLLSSEPANVSLAPPQFTAEHAVAFLSGLPKSLSTTERCTRVQGLLKGLTSDDTTLATELVGEAAQQIVTIRQEIKALEESFQRDQSDDEICIQVLEERLTRLRNQMIERKASTDEGSQALRTRLDEMMGVIVFFDHYQSYVRQQNQPYVPSEVPAFQREEGVRKLLKHHGRLAIA
ncbi:hypothetical protein [Armatimonas sp.]|uniref:hypothetical protein n=1 Tax=Armatimonas sp. TaxID=1872638 RepID=UPI00286B7954|nr:hypothetical protein [Armatimonas sp.]